MGVALALTFTRAGDLIAFAALAPYGVSWFSRADPRQRVVATAFVLVALVAVAVAPPTRDYMLSLVQGNDSSTLGHLNALKGIDDYEYSLLGTGFGSAGAPVGVGTESVLVTLALELGILALPVYLAGLVLLAGQAADRWRRAALTPSYWGLVIATFITMAISEQLLTFNAGWPLIFLLSLAPVREPVD
jgi:hypothetical protein